MAGKLVIATGISGCERKEYQKNAQEFCEKEMGKKMKIYHTGQMLFEQAKRAGVYLAPKNVLNHNPDVLRALLSGVFEIILHNLKTDLKENDAVVINIHNTFYWKKGLSEEYNNFYIGKLGADADMFICFIDNSKFILERLTSREQWQSQGLDEEKILYWQNVEVEITSILSKAKEKKFFVLPTAQPTKTLYRLIFEPHRKPVYINIPITHLTEKEDQEKAKKFIEKLNEEEEFVIFNPLTIETGAAPVRDQKDTVIHFQTVRRDLYWLLHQSEINIAYFPCIVFSPGVINELREAYQTSKEAWVIYSEKEASPFLVYFSTKSFRGEQEFFKFLKERKPPAVKKQ